MKNLINWFEIPAADIKRASVFYADLLGIEFQFLDLGVLKMALFPSSDGIVSGALVQHDFYKPSHEGTLVYFNGGDDLSEMLAKVESAGGKVLKPKSMISPESGYMALFQDTEGNRIA